MVLSFTLVLATASLCQGGAPQSAVIFLHGSGDSGEGFKKYLEHVDGGKWLEMLAQSQIETRFPNSRIQPYTFAGGRQMAVWYDRTALDPSAPEATQTVETSVNDIRELLAELRSLGVWANRTVIGGFSMGGNIAVQLALRHPETVGAAFALSSYLCDKAPVYKQMHELPRKWPPIFMAHGQADDFISLKWGKATAKRLQGFGVPVKFEALAGVRHSMVRPEIEMLREWLQNLGIFASSMAHVPKSEEL